MTDYYVGRKGAFKELLYATDSLLNHNITPRWQVFALHNNLDDINALISLSKELKIDARCRDIGGEFKLFIHQGSCDSSNEILYNNRITKEDLDKIPLEYCLDQGTSEHELYLELLNDGSTFNFASEEPTFYIDKDFNVYPNYSELNDFWLLGNLKLDGIDLVISNYKNNKILAQRTRLNVPVNEMLRLCGDINSYRLFDRVDYIQYLLFKYCEHISG